MSTSAERMRGWRGPAVLGFGFRPFFLAGAVWAALSMAAWLAMLAGRLDLPIRLDPVGWHAHEFLFGQLGAVMAGFLLTAVPNWTGRLPIVGRPLAMLVALWLLGRVAIAVSLHLPPLAVAMADLALPLALLGAIGREIVAGRNWRNLPVLGLIAAFAAGNGLFHWEAVSGGYPTGGVGLRLGLAAAVTLIALVGGRIVPFFTRNWLARRGPGPMPAPPMQRLDLSALLVLIAALLAWTAAPHAVATGALLAAAGLLHLVRLARWAGGRTGEEPLVWILHAGYAFVPLGALAMAAATAGAWSAVAAQHLWTAGAIGVTTLAVMTRATLGHSGRPLAAGPGTLAIYVAALGAVALRLAAGLLPDLATSLHLASGLAWITAFGGFASFYGPLLLRARPT